MCKEENCNRPIHGKGLCSAHYKRLWRRANPGKNFHGDRTDMRLKSNWPEYRIWCQIKDRCLNRNSHAYDDYGARGIFICDEWRNNFDAFVESIGRRPTPKHTLDRKDNDKGYEPGNMRWTTRRVQALNTRVRRDSTSGIKGVQWNKGFRNWQVTINHDGKRHYLGAFRYKEDAIKARKEAEAKYYQPLLAT
jgi:hypothetical protein